MRKAYIDIHWLGNMLEKFKKIAKLYFQESYQEAN